MTACKRTAAAPCNICKRLKTLEKATKRQTPEVKYRDYTIVYSIDPGTQNGQAISLLPQGPEVNSRIGNEVKIRRVEVRGSVGQQWEAGVDVYLFSALTSTIDTSTNYFTSDAIGAFMNPSDYQVWHHEISGLHNGSSAIKFTKTWGQGLKIRYSGSNSGSRSTNELHLLVRNSTTQPTSVSLSIRMWYIDV